MVMGGAEGDLTEAEGLYGRLPGAVAAGRAPACAADGPLSGCGL